MNIKKFLKIKTILIVFTLLFQMSSSQDAFDKNNLNLFLNGLLDGGLIGIDMEDFSINNINYSDLSNRVKTLIDNYQSDQVESFGTFLKTLGSIFSLISKQAEISQFTGPTADLINRFAVPLLVPGEFIFTPKTSLIIYEASLSNEIWKGEKLNLANLTVLGEKLGTLAAKVYYDGKYDFDVLFPIAFPSLRLLQNTNTNNSNLNSKPTWTKKSYQNFENQSLYTLKKTKLGNRNPNHSKQIEEEAKQLKVKVIQKDQAPKGTRNLQATNPPAYDFRSAFAKCALEPRDQKQCGSCWAFSAAGAYEKRVCQSSKEASINRFSPQFLVSCSKGDYGCDGGTLYGSWNHLQNSGIVLDTCMPYLAQNGICHTKCTDNSALKLFKTVPSTITLIRGNVERIKSEIINGGPVQNTFVEIFSDFFSYGSGVYVSDKKQFMGYHAMQIIGWGDGFWIVENSWGPNWGENGNVRVPFDQVSISEYIVFATPQLNTDDNKITCPANCLSCSDANTCIKGGCAAGYVNDSTGGCAKCPENCSVCTSPTCPDNMCKIGFRNDSVSGACVACPANCGKCDDKGCLEGNCVIGFGSDGNGGCVKCSDNCLNCDTTGCKACKEGFSIDLSSKTCKGCDKNCVSCDSTGCLACAKGFFKKSSDGACSLTCPENCKTCSTKIQTPGCSQCNADFSRTLNGDCIKCTENCAYCNNTGCLVCKAGSYLLNKQCVKCGENCNICDSKGCLSYGCASGFYANSNGECVKCSDNCKLCKASGCMQCAEGFAVDSVTKSCKKCSDNCLKCNDKRCLRCAVNFNLSSAGTCFKCPVNCLRCNEKSCLSGFCAKGHGNDTTGGCSKCADNCQSCGPTGCNRGSCDSGYGNNSTGGCSKCSDNCLSCANNLCGFCKEGFYLNSQRDACLACSENCAFCDAKGCLSCKEGFYVSSGKCVACTADCSSCLWNRCLKCMRGFKLSSLNANNNCVKSG